MSAVESLVEHRLGPVDQIPLGEGRSFRVAGHHVAVFRPRGGGLAATQAECPQRGGPLADGMVGLDAVICPLHARRFALSTGLSDAGDCDIVVYMCRVDADDIVVTLPG